MPAEHLLHFYRVALTLACLPVRWFRLWRLAQELSRLESEPAHGGRRGRRLTYAGVALGLLLVCQINAPSLPHRQVSHPCQEQAGLAACVVMGPRKVKMQAGKQQGFTLIEMSIVLVIIGLVVGSIFVGKDMIDAAKTRSQISQVDQYQAAVHTFQVKFNALPGDMNPITASAFGFAARTGAAGNGDGNGELDGISSGIAFSWAESGETLLFWQDLSTAGLIEGAYTGTTQCSALPSCTTLVPFAKMGSGNLVYTYSGYAANYQYGQFIGFGPNFFGLSIFSGVGGSNTNVAGLYNSGKPALPGLSIVQAYNIDKKIDDGIPTTGSVLAQYLTEAASGAPGWSANAASASASTCFDTTSNQYSRNINNGTNVNCGISFKFQ